jgi:UDP-2,3-diacylglucosamine hydrolase
MSKKEKIYFASDFHLGADHKLESSLEREKKIVRWLDSIESDCGALFLVGDVFDYWFEHKEVVPRGFVRFLAKIAAFTDKGIPVHFFSGNHDMWMFDYLQSEIGITLHRDSYTLEAQGKKLFIAHGDGLGPGDKGYKFIKKIFRFPLNQWLFARLHPNLALSLMKFFSQKNGGLKIKDAVYQGPEKEWLIQYCEDSLKSNSYDFFIMGHRHLAIDYTLSNGKSRYINLGDMISFNSYAVLENGKLELKAFEKSDLDING